MKNLDSLNERELLNRAKQSMENIHDLIHGFKEFKKEFTGTEHNPDGGFFNEMRSFKKHTETKFETLEEQVADLKKFQTQQQTGWSLGKWLAGTSLGIYLLSQLEHLQHFLEKLFRS